MRITSTSTDDLLSGMRRYETTVDAIFCRAVERWPERPFVVAERQIITYEELAARVGQAARGLLTLGVRPGHRVALWMSNVWEWVVVQFAVTRLGAVLTPLNTRLRTDDLAYTLRHSGAKVLVTQGAAEFSYVETVRRILAEPGRLPDLQHIVVARPQGTDEAPFLAWDTFVEGGAAVSASPAPAGDASSIAYILYTSGTTARPKGVMLSHAGLNNAVNIARRLRDGDVTFLAYPLFAITGCHNSVLASALVGGAVVLQERFEPVAALDLIERHRCTVLGGIVSVLDALAKVPAFSPERVASLRLASIFPRRPEHLELLRRFGLEAASTGYGMTETAGPVTFCADLDPESMTGEGAPWPGDEVRLVKEDGQPAAPREEGAILVRSPHAMIGYFNDAAATRKTIDADGWLHTGDVGRFDDMGRLTWIGRHSDIIKSSGFNYAAQEVEAFLENHEAIEVVSVVGVPDPVKGEVSAAFVVPVPGGCVTLEEIRRMCAGRIASYKIPGHLFLRTSLPTTASGKVRKVELKSWFMEQERPALDRKGGSRHGL
jgi:acyl-CoA synthetase (AMP-forming)/AMP-acid ligase II